MLISPSMLAYFQNNNFEIRVGARRRIGCFLVLTEIKGDLL